MKNALAIIAVVLVVAVGAWYVASNQPKTDDANIEGSVGGDGTTAENNGLPPGGMETGEFPEPGSGTGVGTGVDVSTGTVKEFTVTGSSFSFSPSTMTVKKGDRVKVTFVNSGGMHDWKLDEFNAATPVIQGGGSATVEFVADKAGSFEYYCSVGTHRQMGMKGTLTVTQ